MADTAPGFYGTYASYKGYAPPHFGPALQKRPQAWSTNLIAILEALR